ncbi:MAG TPA: 2-polyprenyl-3-methyl-6-methoxy-1,4-benzoquinone monooxygenase [Steroidobacteraceae bacterium]|nr:2-polyprenyl-3-methyl-6-methoxy-1,4-benzoquinone monooxygenase [Steroidobacteraceae bacterium]
MESGRTLDSAIAAADRALRALFAPARASRPVPTPREAPQPLSDAQRRDAAALMRVNHTGELAAQALYHGQALLARSAATRQLLLEAAQAESDHLGWCEARLTELQARPSLLNPLWYAGSFAIGALAALAGDRASLGFVAETERQVERHLDTHLERLPTGDSRSRAILERMRAEEIVHGRSATRAGGAPLPQPVQALMRRTAAVMTGTAYWI